MNASPGNRNLGNLRFRADYTTDSSASSPAKGKASSDTSPSRTASKELQRSCIIDGGILLETEHVLLRTAPHLLACTARIRREGKIRLTGESIRVGFHLYEISVPIEAIRQIIAALKNALPDYGAENQALQKLVNTWKEINEKCSC